MPHSACEEEGDAKVPEEGLPVVLCAIHKNALHCEAQSCHVASSRAVTDSLHLQGLFKDRQQDQVVMYPNEGCPKKE